MKQFGQLQELLGLQRTHLLITHRKGMHILEEDLMPVQVHLENIFCATEAGALVPGKSFT